jgi:hypothetical protein
MGLSDNTGSNIYDKSFTCSWGCTTDFSVSIESSATHTIHTKKLFGIGEKGHYDFDSTSEVLTFYDEPTLYWFNTSFILQNCI